MNRRALANKYVVLFSVSGLIVILDQVTKHLVLESFTLGESKTLIPGFFNLTFIQNPGAAFGFLSTVSSSFRVPFLVIIPLLALSAIGLIFIKLPDSDRKQALALSLITGGAIGNLIDRIQFQWVIDWLDLHFRAQWHYPAFNLADVAICIGVGILMWSILKDTKKNSLSGARSSQ